jgi:regulator of protease activity HflC (stomatin/prohibitin superfamily)
VKSLFAKIAAIALCGLALVGCSRVPAGNVGIKYYLLGGDKGVDMEQLGPGRYWIGVNEELYLFPTFTQTQTWVGPEAITFQDKEGLQLAASIGVTYHVDPTKVPVLFQKYRKGVEEITDTYLRNHVRDAMTRAASTRDAKDMYGVGKDRLLSDVQKSVAEIVAPEGIIIEKLYSPSAFALPKGVMDSINRTIEATQIAQQKENELAQARAEAEKTREVARGEKDAAITRAEGKAQALTIEGKALRENPGVSELRAIERWDGKLPIYNTTSAPLPFVNIK